jgi:hypothetical protein
MPKAAEDLIVSNLIEALGRLHEDLDRMELWAAALVRSIIPFRTISLAIVTSSIRRRMARGVALVCNRAGRSKRPYRPSRNVMRQGLFTAE